MFNFFIIFIYVEYFFLDKKTTLKTSLYTSELIKEECVPGAGNAAHW